MPSGSAGPFRHSPNCLCGTCEAAETARQAQMRRREGHFPTALRRLDPVEGREANLQDAQPQWPIRWDKDMGYYVDVEVRGTRNFEEVSLTSSSSPDVTFYSSRSSSSEGKGDVQARGP